MRINVVINLILVNLSGCASIYSLPQDVASANLKMNISSDDSVLVQAFDNKQCDVHEDGVRIAVFTRFSDSIKEKKIRASELIYITYRSNVLSKTVYTHSTGVILLNNPTCSITVGFVPIEGKSYTGDFTAKNSICNLDIYESVNDSEKIEIPSLIISNTSCYSNIN